MQIKNITKAEAIVMLRKQGLEVVLWGTCRIWNNKYQAIICDYTSAHGYTPLYAVALYSDCGRLLARFNVTP